MHFINKNIKYIFILLILIAVLFILLFYNIEIGTAFVYLLLAGILTVLEDGVQNRWLGTRKPGIYYLKDEKKRKKLLDLLKLRDKVELHRKIADLFMVELPDDENKAIQLSYHLLLISSDIEKCLWLLKAGSRAFPAS